jgi:hypothetical protein
MRRIVSLILTLFTIIGFLPAKAADLVTQSDVAAVMTAVPREGPPITRWLNDKPMKVYITFSGEPIASVGTRDVVSWASGSGEIASLWCRARNTFIGLGGLN